MNSRVDTGSQSVLWGVGLFETMLVVRGRVVLGQRHFERMSAAAGELGIPAPAPEQWQHAVGSALHAAPEHDELALRVTLLDPEAHGDRSAAWKLVATAFELPPVTLSRRRNGRVILLPPDVQRAMPRYKSLSHLASVVGLRRARDAGADEGLFTTADSRVLEGTSTNIFAIEGGTLLTPPVDAGILPGIVRGWVIENASHAGLAVQTRTLTREDLLGGSFLTSSLTLLSPIRSVDGETASDPGEPFHILLRRFARETGSPAPPEC